jgi:hypothetical protein
MRRHEQLSAAALMLPGTIVGLILVFFLASPENRDFAVKVVVAVDAVLAAALVGWLRSPMPRLKPGLTGAPALTIGEHFNRTNAYFVRIMVPLGTAWVAGVVLFVTGIPKMQQNALAIGGGVALGLIGSLFIRNQLRCPRCGTDFRKERIAKLGRWSWDTRGTEELWNACPRCGVSFNDPWP